MSYQTMPTEWCVAQTDSIDLVAIDNDAHDESDFGIGQHRVLTTKTRYRRSWVKWFFTKAERDAVKTFMETHKTVVFFYYTDPFSAEQTLVRFTAGFNEKIIGPYSGWDIKFSVEDV